MTDRFANDTEQGNGKDNNAAKRFNALPYPAIRHHSVIEKSRDIIPTEAKPPNCPTITPRTLLRSL
jgi:hypothetical protein